MFQQGSPATFLAGWTAGGENVGLISTPSTVGVVAMRSILCMIRCQSMGVRSLGDGSVHWTCGTGRWRTVAVVRREAVQWTTSCSWRSSGQK
jgi:hypothetical protein